MKLKQLCNLNENRFDFLVSQETMNKAKKLLDYITREYKIQKNKIISLI